MTPDASPAAPTPRQAVLARLAEAHARDATRVDRLALAALREEMEVPARGMAGHARGVLKELPHLHARLAAGVRRLRSAGEVLGDAVEAVLDLDRVPAGQFADEWEALAARLGGYLRPLLVPFPALVALVTEDPASTGHDRLLSEMENVGEAARYLADLADDAAALAEALGGTLPEGGVSDDVRTLLEQRVPPAGRPRPAAERAQGRLLVVDDTPTNRDVLGRLLERMGYSVTVAADGKQALALLGSEAFDLVLLDIIMPEVDGFQVLHRIKADESLRALPVIVISALDETESVARCIEMGAEDYLSKPFDPVFLRARIGATLEKTRLREMIRRRQIRSSLGPGRG